MDVGSVCQGDNKKCSYDLAIVFLLLSSIPAPIVCDYVFSLPNACPASLMNVDYQLMRMVSPVLRFVGSVDIAEDETTCMPGSEECPATELSAQQDMANAASDYMRI